MQKIDRRIVKDLKKFEGLTEKKKRKVCLKRLHRVKERSQKLYSRMKLYLKKKLAWERLIKKVKLYIDKLFYNC